MSCSSGKRVAYIKEEVKEKININMNFSIEILY